MANSVRELPRFDLLDSAEIEDLLGERRSINTKRTLKFGADLFELYLNARNLKFRDIKNSDLDDI